MRLTLIVALLGLMMLSGCFTPTYPLGMSESQWIQLTPAQQEQAYAKQAENDRIAAERLEKQMREERRAELVQQIERRLGIQHEEWLGLTPEKRLAMLEDQERINREDGYRMEELDIQRQAAEAEEANAAAAFEANRLREKHQRDALYNNAVYGNVAECAMAGGTAKFNKGAFSDDWRAMAPTRFTIAKGDGKQITYQRADKAKHEGSFFVRFESSGQEFTFCASEHTDRQYKRCRKHPVSAARLEQGLTMNVSIPEVLDNATLTCKLAPGRKG